MKTTHPLVHCYVLNYNGREVLDDCLTSLLAMEYPNARIFLLDNSSTDGSAAYVGERYPGVGIIHNPRNDGISASRNLATRHAMEHGADWIYHLDNDIRVDRMLVTRLMDAAASDPAIGVMGAKIRYYSDPGRLWYGGGEIGYFRGRVAHRGIRQRDRGQYDTREDTDYVVGCSFLLSRKVVEKTGYFDTVYDPFFTQDADMSVRARRDGFRVVYVPDAELLHRVSTSSGGKMTPWRISQKVEYNTILFKRYARWYHWLTIPWFIGGQTLAYLVREIFKGNFRVVPALFRGFAGGLRRILGSA